MKFTLGERTTPARRVYDVIADAGQASPYEVYRQTQLVASTRDAQWYCRELGRVGVAKPVGSGWQLIQPLPPTWMRACARCMARRCGCTAAEMNIKKTI